MFSFFARLPGRFLYDAMTASDGNENSMPRQKESFAELLLRPPRWVSARETSRETDENNAQNVQQVQQDGKTVNYFLAMNKVSKDFHDNICETDGEKTTVTGSLVETNARRRID